MGIGMRNSFYYMLMTFVISNCWCLKRAVLDDNKIKLYPCPPKQSWCQDHKDYTNDYKCHISSIASRFSEVYKLYPICDEDFKPFDKGAVIVCRAAKRCYVHTLDKIYGHGDKIGKELDDSLGVENSGRVPSGKYDMHIDLKECYPGTKGVLTRHYSHDADKFVYYCTSSRSYGNCRKFYRDSNAVCGPVKLRRRPGPSRKGDINPCPGCQLWCASNWLYTCDYSCKNEVIMGNNEFKYPLCNEDYQPFDFGADKCCNAVRKCADKRHGKLSECVPEYSGGGYFKNGDETTGRYRSWLCVSSQKYGNCDEFYQWCGMKCNGHRLELSPADTKVLWLLLQDSPDLLNKLSQRRKSFCESDLLKINSLNNFWDKTWDFIKKLPGSFVQRSKEVIRLTTLCRFPKQVSHCERMVPKWSCGPSGDGKSEINEVEMGLCVYASFWCANSELVEFTKCCIVHDRCYIDKKGLTKCDGDFCTCLHETSKGKCYVFAGKVFCHVVKDLLGHFVYNGR